MTKSVHGSSHELVYSNTTGPGNSRDYHLSPFLQEQSHFGPFDGADNCFGQMYAPIQAHPYTDASIKVFTSTAPFKAASHISGLSANPFHEENIIYPTLAEVNYELFYWEHGK